MYVKVIFDMQGRHDKNAPDLMLTGHTARISWLAWNRDATRIATIGDDHTLRVWDAQTGKPLLVIPNAQSANWSPDGTRLAVRGKLPSLRIIDATSGKILDTVDPIEAAPLWSPDGMKLAEQTNGTLAVWGKD